MSDAFRYPAIMFFADSDDLIGHYSAGSLPQVPLILDDLDLHSYTWHMAIFGGICERYQMHMRMRNVDTDDFSHRHMAHVQRYAGDAQSVIIIH